jgi:hypothetical protein
MTRIPETPSSRHQCAKLFEVPGRCGLPSCFTMLMPCSLANDDALRCKLTFSSTLRPRYMLTKTRIQVNTWVRVNHEPFDVRIRNEVITKAVRVQRGGAPAVLVQTMLNESVKDEKNLASSASSRFPSRTTEHEDVANGVYQSFQTTWMLQG